MSTPLELFQSCKPLALKIAFKYAAKNSRIEPGDMQQVALEALWDAACRFDSSTGCKFSTYAHHYCAGRCLSHVQCRGDLVRKPSHLFWDLPLQCRVVARVDTETDIHPTDKMLDKLLGESQSPLDMLLEKEELFLDRWEIEEALDALPWHYAYCLERHFLYGDTVREIARKLKRSTNTIYAYISAAIYDLSGCRPSQKAC